jgi:general secretion pathway protein G
MVTTNVKRSGFTLIELLVVLSIIATLLTLAVPRYFGSVERSKEAALKQDLVLMRDALQKYYADKGKYPEKLEDLARDKYLRSIPPDPVTTTTTSWIEIPPKDGDKGGVYDVQSGAAGKSSEGTMYSEW